MRSASAALAGALALGAAPALTERVTAVSGTPQSALAYAASTEPGYVAVFAEPLVVRVSAGVRDVRYRCSAHCRFALSTQPDDVKRVDPQTYDVRVRHGMASLRPTLGTDAPGTFAVEVRPAGHGGRAFARFVLTAR